MRILVTGHDGYIGSVLIGDLVAEGHKVVGTDELLFSECGLRGAKSRCPTRRKDIRDIRAADLRGFEAVIHLAALSSTTVAAVNPGVTFEVNHQAAARLARIAKAAGVRRFLLASTCDVYGDTGEDFVDETVTPRPTTAYGRAKLLAENGIVRLARDKFCPVVLRLASVYGRAPKIRYDRAANNLVGWALATGKVRIKSDGRPWRSLIHVRDVSRAMRAMLKAPARLACGQVFNVGSTEDNYQVHEIAHAVAGAIPGTEVAFDDESAADECSYRVDFERFERRIGRTVVRRRLDEGIADLVAAFKDKPLAPEDFEGPKFCREAQLRHLLGTGAIDERFRWRGDAAEAA